ncbi:thiamine phosphate synthase [Sphingobacterium paramultivorum]|uniref:Thiamine phosphate synthase n=1 Tax=Sphingobacterium paramultivorum TaxID=2886510 RepID=A0A7G5DYX4_9SPHI|nr:thiamine phosphate synthase [Sphingobacterium paramultivorum]QMV66949.1 thiamine phosphate synthase [Sphingobacterium paramultivorum]WSO15787.1 thiamine phosphate synthase [Sphingobacterium paramultivorum]
MIIALTAAEAIPSEKGIIDALFKEGLDILHLRKYHFTDLQMSKYVESIDSTYLDRLVLHSHPHLSAELGIARIHMNEKNRKDRSTNQMLPTTICSTSVHDIDQFNSLDECWAYAFLSPLFPSISKVGYGVYNARLDQLPSRSNFTVGLIGLGGINQDNCLIPVQQGADGIALYGTLWKHPEPVQNFIACKQKLWKNSNIYRRDKH